MKGKHNQILQWSYALILLLQWADWVSTMIGLSHGFEEANPLLLQLGKVIGIYAAVSVAKLIVMFVCWFSYQELRTLKRSEWQSTGVVLNGLLILFYGCTIFSNFSLIYG